MSEPISKADTIILVGEMLKEHVKTFVDPKHQDNREAINKVDEKIDDVDKKVDALVISMTKMETTLSTAIGIFTKLGGLATLIWVVKQIVDIVNTIKH